MNFDRASDRDAHHLITMTANIRSHNEALYARVLLSTLRLNGRVTEEMYARIDEWIDERESCLASPKRAYPRQRIRRDERIVPKSLTTDQRKRLAQQRKEPGVGGE